MLAAYLQDTRNGVLLLPQLAEILTVPLGECGPLDMYVLFLLPLPGWLSGSVWQVGSLFSCKRVVVSRQREC